MSSLRHAALLALGAASLGVSLGASPLRAQGARRASTPASALTRAQELIGDGDVAGGRAVLDSLLGALPTDAPEIASVLYARAATADEAADAERDYRRVAVEYPTASVAADATLRLAQLELQRGERARALERLQRLSNEQPDGPVRAQASYWMARVYFESNDSSRGCYALSIARQALQPADVEVRNQVEFYAPRCREVFAGTASTAQSGSTQSGTTQSAGTQSAGTQITGTQTASTQGTATPPDSVVPPVDTAARVASDTLASRPDSLAVPADSAAPAVAAPAVLTKATKATAKGAKGTRAVKPAKGAATLATRPATKPTRAAAKTTATRTLAPPSRVIYTVQVAAVQQKGQATLLTKQLRAAGFDARVDGTGVPFRVRVGRYATRAAADAMAGRLRARRSDALVVEVPRR